MPAAKFRVPFRHSELFKGREEHLERLHGALSRKGCPVGILPAGLVGQGGIGKTMPAAEYCHRYRVDFPDGVLWVNAANPLFQELAARPSVPGYQPVLRTVVQGYAYRKKVAIRYRPLNGAPLDTTFSTYLLEPSLVGFSTYMIGHSSVVDDVRVFKLERVETAEMTHEDYTIPVDFPGLEYLRSAWSIYTGKQLVHVILRFSSAVEGRLLETRWHPSGTKQDDPQDPRYLIWSVDVADTTDMLPWIRGWGADCEVLEPAELRIARFRVANRLARLYDFPSLYRAPAYRLLRAKADKETGQLHRLVYHLIDVAQVASVLWEAAFPPGVRRQIAA